MFLIVSIPIQKILNPSLSTPVLASLGALLILLSDNHSFFKAAINAINHSGQQNWMVALSLFICLFLLFFLVLLLLAILRPLFKPVLVILLLLAAIVSYFMDNYGVIVNADMIQNVMETDFAEAAELVTPQLLLHLAVFGLLPSFLLCRTAIQYRPMLQESVKRFVYTGGATLLLGGLVFFNYKDFSFILRNNHELRMLVNPNYPLYSLAKYFKTNQHGSLVVHELGMDAKQINNWQVRGKKTVVVMVVGETARAENFSLNGYGQPTNPRLSKEDIINYPYTHSCGTATAVSLPCMFSNLKRAGFSDSAAKQNENLLDVLSHAGIQVQWLDNNSGCKGVCQRVVSKNIETLNLPELCIEGECYDEAMLGELKSVLSDLRGDALIVLHQKGSHGPAYFKRHPPKFKAFAPECVKNEVQDCPQAEITNAYDNTILYTDHFLAEVIGLMKADVDRYNTAMIYMSDHGESLGENGIYLHGLPYSFAPEQQTHIPFVLWLSQGFTDSFKIDRTCLKQYSLEAYSHDNLFHSVLSMLDVRSQIYEPSYDIFSRCRSEPEPVLTKAGN